MTTERCPIRWCDWVNQRNGTMLMLQHLGERHRLELQTMLAGADGGSGEPVDVSLVQQIDARQVQEAADLVAAVLIPKMRARLANDLSVKKLRPLDPWPAVIVRRYAWTDRDRWAATMHNGDGPPGMVELTQGHLDAGMEPDLYQLELRTDAVPDMREVTL